MSGTRKFILLIAGLWLAIAGAARAGGPPVPFKVFTANCYCFDESQTEHLKNWTSLKNAFGDGKVVDLQKGIQKNTGTRRREIAQQVAKADPDVVFFQELWNNDNKMDMIHLLTEKVSKKYKYYCIASNISNSYKETDDGIMMMSKWPPFFTSEMEYNKKYDDEEHAHKGALFMGLYHPSSGFMLLVNTHMQSGTDDESCSIRENQIDQLVRRIRELRKLDWRIENATILVGGDLNEPITLKTEVNALFDRTRYLVKCFNDLGVNINNNQTVAMLCKEFQIKEVYEANQQRRTGVIRTVAGGARPITDPHSPHISRFDGGAKAWTYFRQASEPSGRQLLDHMFVDPVKFKLEKFTVMRDSFLGDKGGPKDETYKPYEAISDHAGVLFEFMVSPSL